MSGSHQTQPQSRTAGLRRLIARVCQSSIEIQAPPPSYESCIAEDQNVDAFVRNVRRNRNTSPLLQLPEAILLILMKSMDVDNVLRLRHVSRTFMRLFHLGFQEYHLGKEPNYAKFSYVTRIWAAPKLSFQNQVLSWIRPACDNCRPLLDWDPCSPDTIREMPHLHCAGCHRPHRLTHFSERQRGEPDSERICRGHESQFTLCSHLSLSLRQIKWQAKTGNKVTMTCHKDHDKGRIRCNNPSCGNSNQPKVRLYDEANGAIGLDITLCSHFRLKRLSSGKICSKSLRDELCRLKESEKDRPWAPIFAFAKGDLLRAFDPNICDCVDWFGDSTKTPKGCLHRPELPLRSAATIKWREDVKDGFYTSTEGRCAFTRHGFTFHTTGIGCNVDIIPCLINKDIAVVCQRLSCFVHPNAPAGTGFRYFLDGAPMGCASAKCASNTCGVRQLQRHDINLSVIEQVLRKEQRG